MKKYLFITLAIFIISSNLEAQCKRGDQLRITNDIEIKVVDCREATRLIYNEGWYPYSLNMNKKIDVLSYLAVLPNIIEVVIGS